MGRVNRTRGWMFGIWAVAALLLAGSGPSGADEIETPSNEELYQMIQQLQADQDRLRGEAQAARSEAAATREKLERTQAELERARAASSERTVLAGVSAASEQPVVRVKDTRRSIEPFAEWVYLRPTNRSLDYAVIQDDTREIVGLGSNKSVTPDYTSGFRIGSRVDFGSGIDAMASWTHFFAEEGDGPLTIPTEPPGTARILATLAHPATPSAGEYGPEADSARGRFDWKYDNYDLEVGRTLEVGKLDLRLFGGVRHSNIDEHFRVTYDGGDFDMGRVSSDVGYWGVGPRVGAGGDWHLPWGLSVFGKAGGSLLVGEAESETVQRDNDDETLVAEIHSDFGVVVVPVVDIQAGVGWETPLGEWGLVALRAGYEFQNFFNMIDHGTWADDVAVGSMSEDSTSLGVDGVFLGGTLSFYGP